MPRIINKRSKKAGLAPGTLIHIGERKIDVSKIELISYDESNVIEKAIQSPDELISYKEKPGVNWINIEGVHQVDLMEEVGNIFSIHPLALEDILNTDQRPKTEDFGNIIFIVLKMLSYNDKNKEIISEQVSIVFGQNFIISFQEGIEGDVFNPLRERIRKGKIKKLSTDYLAYCLIDSVVDNYFIILEKLGEKIEAVQEELLKNPTTKTIQPIHMLKREIIFLHKSVWPLREVVNGLLREESPLIDQNTKIYIRDIYDHTINVMDTIDTYRDMLSGMLEIYLSSTSNRLNEVMRTLTIISTIFMPPTFIAGIYGMNFIHMPELSWKWGYPFALMLMFLTTISLLIYFRVKRWI